MPFGTSSRNRSSVSSYFHSVLRVVPLEMRLSADNTNRFSSRALPPSNVVMILNPVSVLRIALTPAISVKSGLTLFGSSVVISAKSTAYFVSMPGFPVYVRYCFSDNTTNQPLIPHQPIRSSERRRLSHSTTGKGPASFTLAKPSASSWQSPLC